MKKLVLVGLVLAGFSIFGSAATVYDTTLLYQANQKRNVNNFQEKVLIAAYNYGSTLVNTEPVTSTHTLCIKLLDGITYIYSGYSKDPSSMIPLSEVMAAFRIYFATEPKYIASLEYLADGDIQFIVANNYSKVAQYLYGTNR